MDAKLNKPAVLKDASKEEDSVKEEVKKPKQCTLVSDGVYEYK